MTAPSIHSAPTPTAAPHHHALMHLVAPARLVESLGLQRPASLRNSALAGGQAAGAVVLSAAAVHASAWPELAGFAALGALCALFGRFAGSAAQRARTVATAGALLVAPIALLSLVALTGLPPSLQLLALGAVAGLLASLAHRTQMGPPGAVIFVFAASAALAPVDTLLAVAQRSAVAAMGVAVAWLLCRGSDGLRVPPAGAAPPLHGLQHARTGTPLSPGYAPRQALRVACCAALSALLAHAAGWSHPAWAALGAIAVLQGVQLHDAMHRAWQRTLGTLVGAAIAWALLSSSLSFWQLLLAVALLQFVTEAVIGFNYAIGQIAITPMALLMTTLAAPGDATTMALSRIYDTALGAVVGIVLAVLFSTLEERVRLSEHHRRAPSPDAL